jgi:hypothetical protein
MLAEVVVQATTLLPSAPLLFLTAASYDSYTVVCRQHTRRADTRCSSAVWTTDAEQFADRPD